MRAMYISASGLSAEEKKIDLIANNMSNVNTTGYKFQNAYSEEMSQITDDGQNSLLTPAGTNITSINRDFTQGNLVSTGTPLDLAVQGDGFFEVTMPDETIGYTRAGTLGVDANGTLVTKSGYKVYPEITIPDGTTGVTVAANGQVNATMSDGSVKVLGSIELAKFLNTGGLTSTSDGIYQATVASGEPIVDAPGKQGLGTIQQGFQESSNVNLINEMVKMMLTQKSYEMNAKVLQTTDTMMSLANGIKR
jgi:flagellar basal-body rod protein FlgG